MPTHIAGAYSYVQLEAEQVRVCVCVCVHGSEGCHREGERDHPTCSRRNPTALPRVSAPRVSENTRTGTDGKTTEEDWMGSQTSTASGCATLPEVPQTAGSTDTSHATPPTAHHPNGRKRIEGEGTHTVSPSQGTTPMASRGGGRIDVIKGTPVGTRHRADDSVDKMVHANVASLGKPPRTPVATSPVTSVTTTARETGARDVALGMERVPLTLLAAIRADGVYRPLKVLGVGSYGIVFLAVSYTHLTLPTILLV